MRLVKKSADENVLSQDEFFDETEIYEFLSLLHREKQFFGEELMIKLLKEEAQKIGFVL